jgi:hypothetical protein
MYLFRCYSGAVEISDLAWGARAPGTPTGLGYTTPVQTDAQRRQNPVKTGADLPQYHCFRCMYDWTVTRAEAHREM